MNQLFYKGKPVEILAENWEQDDPTEEAWLEYKIEFEGRTVWATAKQLTDESGRTLDEIEADDLARLTCV